MYLKKLSLLLLVVLIASSCSKPKSSEEATEEVEEIAGSTESTAICLGNNVSVRKAPSAKGERITSLAIGEEVAWLDSTVMDSESDYEYALVRLSDGTEGWSVRSYLFQGTQLGAIVYQTPIYSRPDLLTATGESFKPLDLIIYTTEGPAAQGDFKRITGRIRGESSFTTGWVKNGYFTNDTQELVLAQLVYKANELKGQERMDEIKAIAARAEFGYTELLPEVLALTYNDPSGFMKPEFKKYYLGMINFYDSAGHDNFYQFDELTQGVDIAGKTFNGFKYGEWRDNNHWYIWNFFYDFANYAASQGDYEPSGYYKNYYEMADKLSAMEKLSGLSVYDRYTEEWGEFSHVNEDFVSWVSNNLLPKPDEGFHGVAAQKIYNVVFRENARYTWKQWRQMNHEYDWDEYVNAYEDGMTYEDFNAFEFLKGITRGSDLDPVLLGVFIRRKIDDSYDEVIYAMNKALNIYDGDWMEAQKSVDPWTYFEVNYEEEYYGEEEEYYEEDGEYYEEEAAEEEY